MRFTPWQSFFYSLDDVKKLHVNLKHSAFYGPVHLLQYTGKDFLFLFCMSCHVNVKKNPYEWLLKWHPSLSFIFNDIHVNCSLNVFENLTAGSFVAGVDLSRYTRICLQKRFSLFECTVQYFKDVFWIKIAIKVQSLSILNI